MKTGSTGVLCFVSVDHTDHDAARHRDPRAAGYRLSRHVDRASRPRPAKPAAPPPAAKHRESHMADPVLLFRYSALTFNGHRIHYDRDYVTKVEGYPGLIFHGPMQAAFLVEFAAKLHGGTAPKKFSLSRRAAAVRGQRIQRQRERDRRRAWSCGPRIRQVQPTMKGTATW